MRFESLIWTLLALFIVGGAETRIGGTEATTATGEFQAADGGTWNPPPTGP
jgi:hypothetical protein